MKDFRPRPAQPLRGWAPLRPTMRSYAWLGAPPGPAPSGLGSPSWVWTGAADKFPPLMVAEIL